MTTGEATAVPVEWRLFADIDREILHEQVRRRLTPELLEEHRKRPFGPHGPDLVFVLTVLRRFTAALDGKLVVLQHDDGLGLGRLSGRRGTGVVPVGSRRYATRGEAEHAVFLRRLRDLGLARSPA